MLALARAPARPQAQSPRVSSLIGGARVDVCIVGGGLAGMLAAYLLAREKRAVMLMSEAPQAGASAAVEAAPLSSMIEQPYFELEERHGVENARLAAQTFNAAIDSLEGIIRRERIACELERLDGYRFCAATHPSEAEREVLAAHRAGATDVELAAAAPVEGADSGPCVRYPGQIQFHPTKLAEGLAGAIAREGGRVHCGVTVRAIEPGRPSWIVTHAGHRIEANYVVTPDQAPVGQAHVIGIRMPRGAITRALYWDAATLTCARLRSGTSNGETLMVAGGSPPEVLEGWARNHFPHARNVVQRLNAEVPMAHDLFALTGLEECDSESLCVSTASWGSAITRAVVAGMAIRDFAVGARRPEGDRFPLAHALS